jgi:hypothetical protein
VSSNADQVRQNIQQLMQQYGVNYAPSPNFASVDPTVMKQIIGMNATKSEQDQLELQLKLAAAMQDSNQKGSTYEGASVPKDSVYIPPNPLAAGMQMYSHLRGIMDSASAKDQQTALNKKLSDALDSWSSVLQGSNTIASTVPRPQLADTSFDPSSVEMPSL